MMEIRSIEQCVCTMATTPGALKLYRENVVSWILSTMPATTSQDSSQELYSVDRLHSLQTMIRGTFYGIPLGRKKSKKTEESTEDHVLSVKKSNHIQKKLAARKSTSKIDPHVEEQFLTGRLLACVSSRPGQSGRCDGYILEGKELEFYQRKLKSKKGK
ncbi:small ribosomal subunit protein eS8-like [Halichondria panicea]|uniref:small ribosomal subunit protein eS8-like n=1 Tax=Halichondria panicea TaxID=6063 RepID=UPI00312BBDB6